MLQPGCVMLKNNVKSLLCIWLDFSIGFLHLNFTFEELSQSARASESNKHELPYQQPKISKSREWKGQILYVLRLDDKNIPTFRAWMMEMCLIMNNGYQGAWKLSSNNHWLPTRHINIVWYKYVVQGKCTFLRGQPEMSTSWECK